MSKNTKFSLRLMTPEDSSDVENLYKSSTTMSFPLSTFQIVSSPHFLSILLISDKNKVIGVSSSGLVWESRFRGTRDAYIYLFAIDKKYQKKGFGQFLMNQTFKILTGYFNCHRVMCDVQKSNEKGFDFLTKNGFYGQKVYRDFFRFDKNRKEDSIYMMKEFTNNDETRKETDIEIEQNVIVSEQIYNMLNSKLEMSFMNRIFRDAY